MIQGSKEFAILEPRTFPTNSESLVDEARNALAGAILLTSIASFFGVLPGRAHISTLINTL
jgi:hypothetical protein